MGAASCDLPAIVLSGGPMLNGKFRGQDIGSGTDVWRFSETCVRHDDAQDFHDAEAGMSRSAGHCMTMGTASTMACLVEALGLALPSNAAIPAVDSRRSRLADLVGDRIVAMVEEDLKPSQVLTRKAFENAVRAVNARRWIDQRGDSPARDCGAHRCRFSLDDWDRLGREVLPRRPHAVGALPDGGLLLRRRAARGAARTRRSHPSRRAHGHRSDDRAN